MNHAVLDDAAAIRIPARARRRFAATEVSAIAGITTVVHLVLAYVGEYWLDEVYMFTAGRYHPSWGYADQPPLVPMLAAAMDWLAPGSQWALRLPAVVATGVGVLLVGVITRELGGDRRAQLIACGAWATNLWTAIVGHWITTYTIEPTLWLLFSWLLVRWIRVRDDRLLLGLGVVVGVTIQTKFQIFALCGVILLAVLSSGPRALLKRPGSWYAAGIALVIGLPTLLWQAGHGWPQLEMGPVVAGESVLMGGGRTGTATWMLLFAGVAGTGLLLYGLWRLLFTVEFREYRFLGITFVVLYVFFVATLARPYYLCGLYAVPIAAGAVGLQRRRELLGDRRTWLVWPVFGLSLFTAYVAATSLGLHARAAILPTLPSDEVVAERTAAAYHRLPPEIREHTAVLGEDYAFASSVELHARKHGLPQVYSPHRGYGFFGSPGEDATAVLWVGADPGPMRPYFRTVRPLSGGRMPTWLCLERDAAWDEIWPRITHLR